MSNTRRGPNDGGDGRTFELVDARDDPRNGHLKTTRLDCVLEELPILGPSDDVNVGTDQLDTELLQHASLVEFAGKVECRLAPHRRQERIGSFSAQHRGDTFNVERLQVRRSEEHTSELQSH